MPKDKRAKKVEKGFDDLFDEPFGKKRQDKRTQKQILKEKQTEVLKDLGIK